MDIINILKVVPIFQNIADSDIKKIEKIIQKKTFKEGEHIFAESDEGKELYIVNEGRIKIYKLSKDGQIKTFDYLQAGDFFGEMALLDNSRRSANALAMENSVLYIISSEDFQKFLLDYPEVLLTITRTISRRLRKADKEIEMFSFRKVKERLISSIIYLAEKYGEETDKGIRVSIGFTHQDLGELAGTAREVVTRVLKSLKEDKLIEVDKHNIIISSISELKNKISE
jgi:CRP-like cAMP-binding protein